MYEFHPRTKFVMCTLLQVNVLKIKLKCKEIYYIGITWKYQELLFDN